MTNIYDLILNFQENYYEFYEWNNNDEMIHIKKISLMKITSQDYNNILNKKVKFDDNFLFNIFNKCEYYDNKKIQNIAYAILLTDSYRVMAIILDMDGYVLKYSSLSLEDEEDIIDISDRLGCLKINYQILESKNNEFDKTREEIEIINFIKNDLLESYNNKKYDKLKYLYYEYFSRETNDIKKIKTDLEKELEKPIDEKHYNLYQLIKISKQAKRV